MPTKKAKDEATEVFEFDAHDATAGGYFDEDVKDEKKNFSRLPFGKPKATRRNGKNKKTDDPFPEKLPIPEEALARHDTGAAQINPGNAKSKTHIRRLTERKKKFTDRIEAVARAELLNRETEGALEVEGAEESWKIQQREIVDSTDVTAAAKHFSLDLNDFGPYTIDYTPNGRHLLLAGRRGHVAAFDWLTKKLHCEFNASETVRDAHWLHQETMFAVAQKRWTHIYDNQGTELHCLKQLNDIRRLDFLSRHFLLVAGGANSWLHYVDVAVGKMIVEFNTKSGPLEVMCHNPTNAIIHTGHADGTVRLWSPNVRAPLVKLLANHGAVKGVAVERDGNYMYTTGGDCQLRVWDVRMYRQMFAYRMPLDLGDVTVSDRKIVAVSVGSTVQTFRDLHSGSCSTPYLVHRCPAPVRRTAFVPFEDVLGVGHAHGFVSMLVPGAGEANVDALRGPNPYETKRQRKEREVRGLLDKLRPEMIALDPNEINRVNTEMLERNQEERKKILWLRPQPVKYEPRHKTKGRSKEGHKQARKRNALERMRVDHKRRRNEVAAEALTVQGGGGRKEKEVKKEGVDAVLERFGKKRAAETAE